MIFMKKITIKDEVKVKGGFSITGSIDDVIVRLQKLSESLKLDDEWLDLEIEYHQSYDYGEIVLLGWRYETDNEFKSRIKNLEIVEKNKEAAKEKRKKQYERLKQEFEK